jgi:hypothetical protein
METFFLLFGLNSGWIMLYYKRGNESKVLNGRPYRVSDNEMAKKNKALADMIAAANRMMEKAKKGQEIELLVATVSNEKE